MPRLQRGEEGGWPHSAVGVSRGKSPDDLVRAIALAVDAADQPSGTWLKVDLYVQSEGDPNIGGYKAVLSPSE